MPRSPGQLLRLLTQMQVTEVHLLTRAMLSSDLGSSSYGSNIFSDSFGILACSTNRSPLDSLDYVRTYVPSSYFHMHITKPLGSP